MKIIKICYEIPGATGGLAIEKKTGNIPCGYRCKNHFDDGIKNKPAAVSIVTRTSNSFSSLAIGICISLFLFWMIPLSAQDVSGDLIIWHSQPVKPGQTVLLYGGGLSEATVHLQRLEDADPGLPGDAGSRQQSMAGQAMKLIQPRENAVKVVLPDDLKPGVFALKVQSGHRTQMVYVNAPQVWWARGADKLDAFPGGEFRVFGLGLAGQASVRLLQESRQKRFPHASYLKVRKPLS